MTMMASERQRCLTPAYSTEALAATSSDSAPASTSSSAARQLRPNPRAAHRVTTVSAGWLTSAPMNPATIPEMRETTSAKEGRSLAAGKIESSASWVLAYTRSFVTCMQRDSQAFQSGTQRGGTQRGRSEGALRGGVQKGGFKRGGSKGGDQKGG